MSDPTLHRTDQLNGYLARGKNSVGGWFEAIDAEIFRVLLMSQAEMDVRGSAAEIGVHHGKTFIALCLALRAGEKAYCVDIFSDQHLNEDSSGRGDRQVFESNLKRFGITEEVANICQASSFDIKADDIIRSVGRVRFFSVDGGHWLEIVRNDLQIAEACLCEGGIIALDDFHRPEWPDVSAGYFSWFASRKEPIVPFAIGCNKLYLCQESWRSRYQAAIAEDHQLRALALKTARFQGIELSVFSEHDLPQYGFFRRQLGHLRTSRPRYYVLFRRWAIWPLKTVLRRFA